MRVLYCNKYNFAFSGTEVYLFELMELMRAGGHEVALFSMADRRGQTTPFDAYMAPHVDFKSGQRGFVARAKLAGHAVYSTGARSQLRRLTSAFRPQVAHVRNIYHHLSPSVLWELKAQNVPVLYHLNDFKLLCPVYNMVKQGRACEKSCIGQFWQLFRDHCYPGPSSEALVLVGEAYFHHWLGTYRKCVDHFLAPSGFAKQLLVENGFDTEKITVLPHFQRLPEQAATGSPDAPILYFGRLSPEKGVEDLIRAMKSLLHVRLRIAGDGPQRAELENLVRELKLANVEFVGHVTGEKLEGAICDSRFTVLPSRVYETLGKSILESYAWSRAVVASDLGSRRELVQEGKTGLLFAPGNIEHLASVLSKLVARPDLAVAMGAAGREFVANHHKPETHYQALTQLYEELLHSKGQRASKVTVLEPARDKRPIRVAFIGGRGVISKYSGIESYYEEVGKRLVEMGYEVTVYCRTHFTPDLAIYNGMRLVRLPTIRSKHLETLLHTALSTVHAIAARHDVVHYHALGPALFSAFPRMFGQKTVVTVQGLDWQRKKWRGPGSFVLRLGELASAKFPDRTMVVSRVLQKRYRDKYGLETSYIPNGTCMRERLSGLEMLKWGLEPGGYILFLGRLSPEKNCHLLIEACEKVAMPAKLVLAGGSSHTGAYAAGLREHQSDRILFLDWVSGDALEELLTNAALFVLPSDLEGLSLALLDAMGAGVCVLTSDIPENRELVEGAGFTFRAGNVDDLSRMLELLLRDEPRRKAAGRRGQERVRKHYLWPSIASQIAGTYEELTGSGVVGDQPTAVSESEAEQVA